MGDILIVSRDLNGKKTKKYLQSDQQAWEYCQNQAVISETEILLVCSNNMCVYSELCSCFPIDWEDLVAFFA